MGTVFPMWLPVPGLPSVGSDLLHLLLRVCGVLSLCLARRLISNSVSILIPFQYGLLSKMNCGRSVLAVLRCFQRQLHRCSCYLGMSVGQGELRILPLCHLPDSPCWLIIIMKTGILLDTMLPSVLRPPATHWSSRGQVHSFHRYYSCNLFPEGGELGPGKL